MTIVRLFSDRALPTTAKIAHIPRVKAHDTIVGLFAEALLVQWNFYILSCV